MSQLSPQQVLNPDSQDLVAQNPDQTTSLSFLSYKSKILAGTWRFLTYFGRDSMISVLLMRSILSQGEGGALEAAISAVLERVDKNDGTVLPRRGYWRYPQMSQLSPQQVLNPDSQDLVAQNPDQTTSLSFLSYKSKILAGTWRFLTYFGRDSMISVLLMRSILSQGEGGALEAAISAVLERVDKNDGTVCHEEVIGDIPR